MTLPRIVVTLAEHVAPGGGDESGQPKGWSVDVREWESATPLVESYDMDACPVEVDGMVGVVPVLPPLRQIGRDAPHAELCAGDAVKIADLIIRLDTRSGTAGDATLYGRWLFQCLLAPAWEAILALPAVETGEPRPGVEIALQWPANATDLHRLVWEAMHDGQAPLAGHARWTVAITRLVPVDIDEPTPIDRLPKVLFAVGASMTDEVIRPGAMFVGLLQALEADGICVSRVAEKVGIAELTDQCRRFNPDVVHVVAHGDVNGGEGRLRMEGESGCSWVGAEQLAGAMAVGGLPVAVVLSACRTGGADGPPGARPMAAELVTRGVPIVSAMAGDIGEQACRLYTRKMAEAIHAGEPVVDAAAAGRRAAMLRAERSDTQLDWAMPAMFMARCVKPGYRAVHPSSTRDLLTVATDLDLRHRPVFVGRSSILESIGLLVETDEEKRLGFTAICGKGNLTGLGSRRLLREIGFRLLRSGHVPLLLGPYGDAEQPKDLRALLVEILECVNEFTLQIRSTLKVDCPPVPMEVLGADPGFEGAADVRKEVLGSLTSAEAGVRVVDTLRAFAQRAEPLEPKLVAARLPRDLQRLAEAAAAAGPPFGADTRVVVLGINAHQWVGALGPFLKLIRPKSGLGIGQHPVPVVITASLAQGAGQELDAWIAEHQGPPGYSFPELAPLAPLEAALGFQWVLLHPWRPRHPKVVYTAARNSSDAQVLELFAQLGGMPSAVCHDLYLVAETARISNVFMAQNDEDALAEYAERRG